MIMVDRSALTRRNRNPGKSSSVAYKPQLRKHNDCEER